MYSVNALDELLSDKIFTFQSIILECHTLIDVTGEGCLVVYFQNSLQIEILIGFEKQKPNATIFALKIKF